MKKFLIVTFAAVIALFVTSCASSERMMRMSGPLASYAPPESSRIAGFKPNSSLSYRAAGGTRPGLIAGIIDDRLINIWPFFFRNDQYYSVLWPIIDVDPYGMAVRPFYNQEGNEYSILFPLSAWNPVNGDGWVLSGYWNQNNTGFFPLFNLGNRLNYLLPVWWRKRNRETTSGGIFPVARFGDGMNYVVPAWWYRRNGETVSGGLFPVARFGGGLSYVTTAWWYRRNNGELGSAGVYPLGGWFRGSGKGASGWLLPLFMYTPDFLTVLNFWSCRDDWQNWGVFPLFWRFRDMYVLLPLWRDDRDFGIFPVFRWRDGNHFYAFPLAGNWGKFGFAGPVFWDFDSHSRTFGVLPLFVSTTETNSRFLWTPLFLSKSTPASRTFTLLSLGWLLWMQEENFSSDALNRWEKFYYNSVPRNDFQCASLPLLSIYNHSFRLDKDAAAVQEEQILADTLGKYCMTADNFDPKVLNAGIAAAAASGLNAPPTEVGESADSYIRKLSEQFDRRDLPEVEEKFRMTLPFFIYRHQAQSRSLTLPLLLSHYSTSAEVTRLDLLWPLLWSNEKRVAASRFPNIVEMDEVLAAGNSAVETSESYRLLLWLAEEENATLRVPTVPGRAQAINQAAAALDLLKTERIRQEKNVREAAILEALLSTLLPANEKLPEYVPGENFKEWNNKVSNHEPELRGLLTNYYFCRRTMHETAATINEKEELLAGLPELSGERFETPAEIKSARQRLLNEYTRPVRRNDFKTLGFRRILTDEWSKWSFLWILADGETTPERERAQVLGYFYRYNREEDRSNTLCFPFISIRRDGDDSSWSFLYRMLEIRNQGGKTSGYICFIPFGE